MKKNIGKCTVKPHIAAAVNVNDACIAGKDIGIAQSSAVSSSQSAAKTNEPAKVNLCTIKTLKAENEHLLKKVKQLSEDKNETEDKLQKELEFYKKYYKIDQYNRERGRCIAKNLKKKIGQKIKGRKREKRIGKEIDR